MHRRGLFGGAIGAAMTAAFAAVAHPANVTAVEVVPGMALTGWVALGDRWAFVSNQDGQPTITWTGRYDESGEFQYDEFGTFIPGYVAPNDGAE